MINYPACKVNLGLNITSKRQDGYHNIETVFYPVKWADALEIIKGGKGGVELHISGLKVEGKPEDNILFRAWKLLSEVRTLPPVKVYLHKVLPMGAGLGGGSSDAAFLLKMANHKLNLDLSTEQLTEMASKLGADCAFFIENRPVFAQGKGDEFEPVKVNLDNYYILIVYPGIASNTREAYEGVSPAIPQKSIKEIISGPVETWKDQLVNNFEASIFKKYPSIADLKNKLYNTGAVYASMSGSGSAVYGIFKDKPAVVFPNNYSCYLQTPLC